MLNPKTWLAAAQALPEGRSARVEHDCGPGQCMMVSHKVDGWSAHCFRCSEAEGNGWVPRPPESLTERLERIRRMRVADIVAAQRVELPSGEPDPSTWPLAPRVWLYKAGLSNTDIQHLGITWSDRMQRVIIPLYQDGELTYWQARSVAGDPDIPKYLNQKKLDRTKLLFEAGDGPLVLTEDILSAYKVSKAGYTGWGLMGTALNDYQASRIVRRSKGQEVAVWLDPDKPGRSAANSICATLRSYGVRTRNIKSQRDPKLYSRESIQQILGSMQ